MFAVFDMFLSRLVVVWSSLFLGVAANMPPAVAAPNQPAMTGASEQSTGAAGASTPMAVESGALGQEGSKTIQMLLELQESNPELHSADRSKPRSGLSVPEPHAKAMPPMAPAPERASAPQNPFTQGFEPPVKSPPRESDQTPSETSWSGSLSGGEVGAPQRSSRRTDPSDPGDSLPVMAALRLWLPTSVMRFVRENRELVVISSLLVLVLVWFGAAKASRHGN